MPNGKIIKKILIGRDVCRDSRWFDMLVENVL